MTVATDIPVRTETRPTSVEARLTRLEDRERIRDLIMRYGVLCDQRRWDELVQLYTDDVERVLTGTLDETVRGRDALKQLLIAPALPRGEGQDNAPATPDELLELDLKHMIATTIIHLDDGGQRAEALVYYTMAVSRGVGPTFERGVHDGVYEFTFEKQPDGDWLFSRQVISSGNANNPLFRAREEASR